MERTLIFKSNMSPMSSLRRRSSCYNIQRAEQRDRRKSSKFECTWIFYNFSVLFLLLFSSLKWWIHRVILCMWLWCCKLSCVFFPACQKIVGTRLSSSSQCLSGGSRPVTPQPLANSPSHNHSTFLYKVMRITLLLLDRNWVV